MKALSSLYVGALATLLVVTLIFAKQLPSDAMFSLSFIAGIGLGFALSIGFEQHRRRHRTIHSLIASLPEPTSTWRGAANQTTEGKITLVGAGPGSPELLTLAAHRALAAADVVICDKIGSPELHTLIKPGAVLKIAEKIPGNADAAQAELNAWGVDALCRGQRVVRLKVGDPYLYGRGGEEWAFYRSQGYTPDVIPGVSSALLAPLVAGIPVTHRGAANSVLITTGQGRGGTFPALPPFDPQRTLVMLMAVGRIPTLAPDLSALGYPLDTPVAIIERAAHPDERTTLTDLTRLAGDAAAVGVTSPAVLVIGKVVHAQKDEEAKLLLQERALTLAGEKVVEFSMQPPVAVAGSHGSAASAPRVAMVAM